MMVMSIMGILPFIMFYGSELLFFTRKLHCLQTFEYMCDGDST